MKCLFSNRFKCFIYLNRNIFLTNDDRIVLGDLGICRAFSTDSTSMGSSNVGSFPYKSPEMINSYKSYSFNTDIW